VCRQWQEASNNDGCETLQLFMDLSTMSDADHSRSRRWLVKYGQQVEVVVLGANKFESQQLKGWFWQSAPALSNLKRLEVEQQHSLALLSPLLEQLPQLQRLAAGVSMGADYEPGDAEPAGMFLDEYGQRWATPPDLQELCPQLVDLQLTLQSDLGALFADERLPVLLPARLQQLALVARAHFQCVVSHQSLLHLTGLQQLDMDGVAMAADGAEELGAQLVALQQLRVSTWRYGPMEHMGFAHPLVQQVAPKVAAFRCSSSEVLQQSELLANLSHLTSLMLNGALFLDDGAAEADDGAELAPLTALQELALCGLCGESAVSFVQQAAGMAQLCALHLEGSVFGAEEMSASLAQCTQLTSLVLLLDVVDNSDSDSDTADSQHRIAAGGLSFLPVPEQLTGLRHLTISKNALLEGGGGWLGALTQLTSLHVVLPKIDACRRPACNALGRAHLQVQEQQETGYVAAVKEQLQQVVGWPASLQQVVLWVHPEASIGVCKTWSFFPPGAGSRQVTVWYEQQRGTAKGWARPFSPCPYLPGVWELQGEVAGSNWQVQHW
jgi:hypothetical protein